MKFRQQHTIDIFIVDFASIAENLVVEVDVDYHDEVYEADKSRQAKLEALGWRVIRFTNEEVLEDVELVAYAIANFIGKGEEFRKNNFKEWLCCFQFPGRVFFG